jgi:hypothetical protein
MIEAVKTPKARPIKSKYLDPINPKTIKEIRKITSNVMLLKISPVDFKKDLLILNPNRNGRPKIKT